MSLSDELKELEALLRNGTLTQDEFQIAKRRVLEGPPSSVQSSQFAEIKAQNDLAQIDREWALERETYMITGKYGRRFVPEKVSSVIAGIVIGGFGSCWTIGVLSIPRSEDFGIMGTVMPIFGVVFVLVGISMSIRGFVKAGQYQAAYERYRIRRCELVDRSRSS